MLLCAILIFAAIVYRWISLERLQRVVPADVTITPSPGPTASRPPVLPTKIDTAKLFNGITLHATVDAPPGADASTERADPQSYIVELQLKAKMPAPDRTIEELAKISPQLPALLPGLATMLNPNAVSPLFGELYATKVRILRENLDRIGRERGRLGAGIGELRVFLHQFPEREILLGGLGVGDTMADIGLAKEPG